MIAHMRNAGGRRLWERRLSRSSTNLRSCRRDPTVAGTILICLRAGGIDAVVRWAEQPLGPANRKSSSQASAGISRFKRVNWPLGYIGTRKRLHLRKPPPRAFPEPSTYRGDQRARPIDPVPDPEQPSFHPLVQRACWWALCTAHLASRGTCLWLSSRRNPFTVGLRHQW